MYGIFTYIYPINDPDVGKYTSPMDHLGIFQEASQKSPGSKTSEGDLTLGSFLKITRMQPGQEL